MDFIICMEQAYFQEYVPVSALWLVVTQRKNIVAVIVSKNSSYLTRTETVKSSMEHRV